MSTAIGLESWREAGLSSSLTRYIAVKTYVSVNNCSASSSFCDFGLRPIVPTVNKQTTSAPAEKTRDDD